MLKAEPVPANEDPPGVPVEEGVLLSTPNERANWLYYDVTLGCVLDSGVVVHRRLPQVDNEYDTLGTCDIDGADIDALTGLGVNLKSNDRFEDVVQRMAHSQYWFRLWGQALRIGEQVPIPRLKEVAGVKAVPYDQDNPQWGYNKIAGNYSGQILWYAQWSQWYTLAKPPRRDHLPPQNVGQHIAASKLVPVGMQSPWSLPDDNAQLTLQQGVR